MINLHSWIKYLLRIVGSLSIPSNYVSIFHVFSYSFHKNMYFMLMRCHMRRYKNLQNGKSAKTFTEDQITFLKNLFFGILLNWFSFSKEFIKNIAINSWLQLLQMITDCKLVATVADSWLQLQPAETMIKMGFCNELAISYQLQQLQPAINCSSSTQLANNFEQHFSNLPADCNLSVGQVFVVDSKISQNIRTTSKWPVWNWPRSFMIDRLNRFEFVFEFHFRFSLMKMTLESSSSLLDF